MFVTPYADLGLLAGWVLRQNGRARPLEPEELVAEVGESLARVVERHDGRAPARRRGRAELDDGAAARAAGGPVPPERFAVLQALLAHLLAACGDSRARRSRPPSSSSASPSPTTSSTSISSC